jgi:hypothetical protein
VRTIKPWKFLEGNRYESSWPSIGQWFLKEGNKNTSYYDLAILLLCTLPKEMKTCQHKDLYKYVHSSIIHETPPQSRNSPNVHNWWTQKVHVLKYDMTIQRQSTDTSSPWMALEHLLRESSQSQRITLHDSFYMKCPEHYGTPSIWKVQALVES